MPWFILLVVATALFLLIRHGQRSGARLHLRYARRRLEIVGGQFSRPGQRHMLLDVLREARVEQAEIRVWSDRRIEFSGDLPEQLLQRLRNLLLD